MTTQPKREPLKVGERCAIYGISYQDGWLARTTGTIKAVHTEPASRLTVHIDDTDYTVVVMPQQVRRIRPRQRRQVWVDMPPGGLSPDLWFMAWGSEKAALESSGRIHGAKLTCFREVRSGRKTGGSDGKA
jgi:hypothetical protein